ncbi:hypothetical protein C4573_02340 [Candidatus Woesearchaeota archaeon]|nr:MAG: hypothetical protein C4573_02340 [Candidatus Woesearchaeota archaeon]
MVENRTVFRDKTIRYTGLVNIAAFYKMIDDFFRQRGYDKNELKNFEEVRENERQIIIEIIPYKKISDYTQLKIKLNMLFAHLKDVQVEGSTEPLQSCNITIVMDAFLETDYEGRWDSKPFYYFLRTVFDKYVFKGYVYRNEQMLRQHADELEIEIKSYLNMARYR